MSAQPVAPYVRVQIDTSAIVNAVANHSGQNRNAAGWTTTEAVSTVVGMDAVANFGYGATSTVAGFFIRAIFNSGAAPKYLDSPAFAVVPGRYVGARYDSAAGSTTAPTMAATVVYFDGNGAVIGTPAYPAAATPGTGPDDGRTPITLASNTVQVPAGAATARIRFKMGYSGTYGQFFIFNLMVAQAATSAGATGVAFSDPQWSDIAGAAVSVKINRGGELRGVLDEIEAGTLTAEFKDATLSPAINAATRPGRLVRALAAHPSAPTTWVPLFTGYIDGATAVYGQDKGRAAPRVRITATDAVPLLRNVKSPYGYSGTRLAKMRALMNDSPIPYNDGGGGADFPSKTMNSLTRDATLWDQLELMSDTFPGSTMFVDAGGVLQSRSSDFGAVAVTLSGDAGGAPSFTDLDTGFSSDALVNELFIRRVATDETEGEKLYGPYSNPSSVQAWRRVSSEVRVSDGVPFDVATAYLRQYSTPTSSPRSITFSAFQPLTGTYTAPAELFDLYRTVRVQLTSAGLNPSASLVILGIEHTITPTRWTVKWTLRRQFAITPPAAVIKSPDLGPTTGPDDVLPPAPGVLGSRRGSTNQVLPATATFYAVDYDAAEQVNSKDVMDGGITWDSSAKRFVVPKTGRYDISTMVTFAASTTGRRLLRPVINGATPFGNVETTPGAQLHAMSWSRVHKLTAGDTVGFQVYQTAAANFTLNAANGIWCSIAFLD